MCLLHRGLKADALFSRLRQFSNRLETMALKADALFSSFAKTDNLRLRRNGGESATPKCKLRLPAEKLKDRSTRTGGKFRGPGGGNET